MGTAEQEEQGKGNREDNIMSYFQTVTEASVSISGSEISFGKSVFVHT